MTMLPPAHAEDELSHLAQQFAQWRHSRTTPRGRIPKPLWAQAVALAHGATIPTLGIAMDARCSTENGQVRRRRGRPHHICYPSASQPPSFFRPQAGRVPPCARLRLARPTPRLARSPRPLPHTHGRGTTLVLFVMVG